MSADWLPATSVSPTPAHGTDGRAPVDSHGMKSACAVCKRAKRRCEGGRPCTRCRKSGREIECMSGKLFDNAQQRRAASVRAAALSYEVANLGGPISLPGMDSTPLPASALHTPQSTGGIAAAASNWTTPSSPAWNASAPGTSLGAPPPARMTSGPIGGVKRPYPGSGSSAGGGAASHERDADFGAMPPPAPRPAQQLAALPLCAEDMERPVGGGLGSEAILVHHLEVQNVRLDYGSESALAKHVQELELPLASPDSVPPLAEPLRTCLARLHDRLFLQSPSLGQHAFSAILTGLVSAFMGTGSPSTSVTVQGIVGQAVAASTLPCLHVAYWHGGEGGGCTPVLYASDPLCEALGITQATLPGSVTSSLAPGPGGQGFVQQHHLSLRHLHGSTLTPRLRAITRCSAEQAAMFTVTGLYVGHSGAAGGAGVSVFPATEHVCLQWAPWSRHTTLDSVSMVFMPYAAPNTAHPIQLGPTPPYTPAAPPPAQHPRLDALVVPPPSRTSGRSPAGMPSVTTPLPSLTQQSSV